MDRRILDVTISSSSYTSRRIDRGGPNGDLTRAVRADEDDTNPEIEKGRNETKKMMMKMATEGPSNSRYRQKHLRIGFQEMIHIIHSTLLGQRFYSPVRTFNTGCRKGCQATRFTEYTEHFVSYDFLQSEFFNSFSSANFPAFILQIFTSTNRSSSINQMQKLLCSEDDQALEHRQCDNP